MATGRIEVVFLHCDQGMGTQVRIYDTSDKLAHLVLIDFGAEPGKKKYAELGMNSIINSLKRMQTDGFVPGFDLLIVSHQDYDHWSLLPDLLKKIQTDFKIATCKRIITGGTGWKTRASNAIIKWKDYFKLSGVESFNKEATSYGTPGVKTEVANIDGVVFRVLGVNVPISRSAEDLERNGTSAVMVIDFGGVSCVIPGDATADTCGWINTMVYEPWFTGGHGVPTFPCRALGAPHHGALRTIASNFVASSSARLDIAGTFANFVAAENVIASAGYESKFFHPYKEVMEVLGVKAITNQVEHSFVWFVNALDDWERIKKSERGLFTTVTKFSTPPRRTGWRFSISKTGEITFELDWEQAITVPPEELDRYPATPHER